MITILSILLITLFCVAGNAAESPCSFYYSKELKKNVYTQVEIEPDFPGGAAGYQRFLNKNLKFPQDINVD